VTSTDRQVTAPLAAQLGPPSCDHIRLNPHQYYLNVRCPTWLCRILRLY